MNNTQAPTSSGLRASKGIRIPTTSITSSEAHQELSYLVKKLYLDGEKARRGDIKWSDFNEKSSIIEDKIRYLRNIINK